VINRGLCSLTAASILLAAFWTLAALSLEPFSCNSANRMTMMGSDQKYLIRTPLGSLKHLLLLALLILLQLIVICLRFDNSLHHKQTNNR